MHPLNGLRVVEFEGLGPGPVAGRWLADLGADVLVIARPTEPEADSVAARLGGTGDNPLRRGKRVLKLNLKQPADRDRALQEIRGAQALIEGFRPGVMERLGLGPADCAQVAPALVYGRMTGWGQDGPLAQRAGHDLNYLALSGLLGVGTAPEDKPRVPPTMLGDAAGALGLAFGLVCGVWQARSTGRGCVVDAAIADTAVTLGALLFWMRANGQIDQPAQASAFHDSPFYDLYRCADGQWLSVAALEAPFYRQLIERLGLSDTDPAAQYERQHWPALKARIATLLATRDRDHWCELFAGSDACVAPVLSLDQAMAHPHHRARASFSAMANGQPDAAPAPRFSPLSP